MNPQDGMVVDHIDGNALNNCRSNLRLCTEHENSFNKKKYDRRLPTDSRFKGVCFFKSGKRIKRWKAEARRKGVGQYSGYYKTELEAARAYNVFAKELFGDFARLNPVHL